jgi:hypothetical protein
MEDCNGKLMACRQQTAPPQQQLVFAVVFAEASAKTTQPIHTSPGPTQTPHTSTEPTAAATTQPKPR